MSGVTSNYSGERGSIFFVFFLSFFLFAVIVVVDVGVGFATRSLRVERELPVEEAGNLLSIQYFYDFSINRSFIYNINLYTEEGWVAWNDGSLLFRPQQFDSGDNKALCHLLDSSSLQVQLQY